MLKKEIFLKYPPKVPFVNNNRKCLQTFGQVLPYRACGHLHEEAGIANPHLNIDFTGMT